MLRILLTALCVIPSVALFAQQAQDSAPKPIEHRNAIMVNFPNYVQCAEFPGIGFGLEFRRVLRPKGDISMTGSFTRLFWAGTPETGEHFSSGTRADVGASLLGAGLNYLPFGSEDPVTIELGVVALFGQFRRVDFYQQGYSTSSSTSVRERSFFASPQGHIAFTFQDLARGLYQFSVYGEFGPILTAGSNTRGNYGTIGMKFGSRL